MQFATLTLAALSIGSVLGSPTVIGLSEPKVLTSAIGAVSNSKSAVDTQLVIIRTLIHSLNRYPAQPQANSSSENLVQTTVNDAAIPALRASLNNIAAEITSVTNFVVPLVTDVALPLAQQELDNLPGFVTNVKGIAGDVQYTANFILANLSQRRLFSKFMLYHHAKHQC